MAFLLLCISIFVIFFQPAFVFPVLSGTQPLKAAVICAFASYFFSKKEIDVPFLSNRTNRFFVGFAIMQVLSSCSIWITGGIETLNVWLRIGLTYFLVFKSTITEKRIKTIMIVVVLGVGYVCFYSIVN